MNIGIDEFRKRVREWAKGNERIKWFSEEELLEIANEAERAKNQGSNFIQVFDQLIFENSFKKIRSE